MKIEIHLHKDGGTVLLDGVDISRHVLREDIVIRPGGSSPHPPVVYLPLMADVSVTSNGLVKRVSE